MSPISFLASGFTSRMVFVHHGALGLTKHTMFAVIRVCENGKQHSGAELYSVGNVSMYSRSITVCQRFSNILPHTKYHYRHYFTAGHTAVIGITCTVQYIQYCPPKSS